MNKHGINPVTIQGEHDTTLTVSRLGIGIGEGPINVGVTVLVCKGEDPSTANIVTVQEKQFINALGHLFPRGELAKVHLTEPERDKLVSAADDIHVMMGPRGVSTEWLEGYMAARAQAERLVRDLAKQAAEPGQGIYNVAGLERLDFQIAPGMSHLSQAANRVNSPAAKVTFVCVRCGEPIAGEAFETPAGPMHPECVGES